MAQRSVRWQLGERGPDTAQRLLPPPDAGPDRHHRPGWIPPGPQLDLLQAAGAQRGDPRHDPPRPGLPGRHNLPPRLQRLRDQPLTGAQEPPAPSFPTLNSPVTSTIDPSKTISTSLTAIAACAYRRSPAAAHLAPASSCVSAAPAAQLQTDACLLPSTTPKPEHLDHNPNFSLLSSSSSTVDSDSSLLDFPKPPDLFSSHCCSKTPDFTMPRTQEPRRSYLNENLYHPFRGHSSNSSPLLHLHSSKRQISPFTSNMLQTVASEPTLLTHSDTPVPPQGSHLPHFPRSPYKHSGASPILHPGHHTVLTHGPAPSSSLLPPPPPSPCPTGPEEASAWGCCCTLGAAATPLSRYLGKVGHTALPLLKVGGLLNAEPSDVQTWQDLKNLEFCESKCLKPTIPD